MLAFFSTEPSVILTYRLSYLFLGTVLVRDLAVVGLCVLVIREIYRPSTDLVRLSGDDDPAGGFLDGARDARVPAAARRRKLATA